MPVYIIDEARLKKTVLVRRVVTALLDALGKKGAEVSVLLTGDDGIRALNKKFRKMDRATDVLSFPMHDETMLGDVVVSVDRVKAQARAFKSGEDNELCRLLIHGLLHLSGFDHVQGGTQARRMKAKEEELMREIKAKGAV